MCSRIAIGNSWFLHANIAFVIRKAIHSHPASHFEAIINYDQTPHLSSSDQLLVEAFLIFCLPSLASFTPTTKKRPASSENKTEGVPPYKSVMHTTEIRK
jgi:hypothetical protein